MNELILNEETGFETLYQKYQEFEDYNFKVIKKNTRFSDRLALLILLPFIGIHIVQFEAKLKDCGFLT